MDKPTVDKEAIKKIDAEAKRRYPENWRHTTPSERVAVFDDGLDSRSAFVAGCYYMMDTYAASLSKERDEKIAFMQTGIDVGQEMIDEKKAEIEVLNKIIETKEAERKEWADMCIKKQSTNEAKENEIERLKRLIKLAHSDGFDMADSFGDSSKKLESWELFKSEQNL